MTPDEPRYVCHACIGDKILTEQVENEGTQAECSYCRSAKAVVTLRELSNRIHQVLEEHFQLIDMPPDLPNDMFQPEDYFPEQSENHLEGIETVIQRVAGLQSGIAKDVREFLFDRLAWTVNVEEGEENPYSPGTWYGKKRETDTSDLRLAWSDFRDEIHSRSRFFGDTTKTKLHEIFADLTSPKTLWRNSVIREIKPGDDDSFVWRARTVYPDDELERILESLSKEIGPPPSDKAKAGRMNAEGIPVFYGALEEKTCVSEVRAPVGSLVVLGKFELLNPINILDLAALSDVYSAISYFDPHYTEERSREKFLRELVGEISRPVMPHEEVREYLATQVMSEYLANRIKPRLHGMIFRSSQTGGDGRNIVLFNWASSVEANELSPGTVLQVVIPRQPGIPPPGTEPSKDLTIQTERTAEDPTPSDPETRDNHGDDILRLDAQSVKVLRISGVKYESDSFPLQRLYHVSAGAVRFRFDTLTAKVTLSARYQGQEAG